jgi:hypothetical protein
MFGNIRADREFNRAQKELARLRSEKKKAETQEDPWANMNNYEGQVQKEAARIRQEQEQAGQRAKTETDEMFANMPKGLEDKERENLRNQQKTQIDRDLQNYNRMLGGQHSVRGVRGGVAAAQQADLARMGRESMTDFERGLADLDTQLSMKKLVAKFANVEGSKGEQALINQQAYDKILGYLQNENQRKLAQRADKFFYNI